MLNLMTLMWTEQDLQDVSEAIKQLVLGKRLVKLSFSGPGGSMQTNEYQPTDLPQLRALYHEIKQTLAESQDEPATYTIISRKFI